MIEYKFVGHIYHGLIVFEGKTLADDHFIVVDEYKRPGEPGYAPSTYCLLMSIRTGVMHEVALKRLQHSSHYKRVG